MSARTVESSLRSSPGQNTFTMFPDGKIATFAFDKVGSRTTIVNWGGTSAYAFDALGRQSGQTDAAGLVQSYGYDPNGNRTGLNLVGTGLFTYTFDSLNRLATANLKQLDIKVKFDDMLCVGTRCRINPKLDDDKIGDVSKLPEDRRRALEEKIAKQLEKLKDIKYEPGQPPKIKP